MSQIEKRLSVIRDVYAAFGRGDVPAILERLHPEVDWEPGTNDYGVPWLKPGRGRAHAGEFFKVVGGLEIQSFDVADILASEQHVVALVRIRFRYPPTGKVVNETCEVHVWKLNDAGQVTSMRHVVDTAMHRAACS